MLCTDVCNGVDLKILQWDLYHKKILWKLKALPLGLVFNLTKIRPKPKILYEKNVTKMLLGWILGLKEKNIIDYLSCKKSLRISPTKID